MKWLLLVILLLLFPSGTKAQSREAVVLAILCVSEAGWEPGADCDAIYEVITWRAKQRKDMTFTRMAMAYGRSAFDHHRTDSRAWVVWLNRNLREPKYWPAHLPWSTYQRYWINTLIRAEELLAGTRKSWCQAEHWGAPGGNAVQAHRRGWTRVSCGETKNVFWRE